MCARGGRYVHGRGVCMVGGRHGRGYGMHVPLHGHRHFVAGSNKFECVRWRSEMQGEQVEDVQRGLGSGGPFTVRSHVLGGRARIWGGGGFLYVEVKYIMDNGDVGPTLHVDR